MNPREEQVHVQQGQITDQVPGEMGQKTGMANQRMGASEETG